MNSACPRRPIVIEPDPAPPLVVDEGFDWASAAIGASAAGGLILLIGAGGSTYYNRRRPHTSLGDRPSLSRVHLDRGQDMYPHSSR